MLVSAIQYKSAIIIYIYVTSLFSLPPPTHSHPSRSSQSTVLGSLCYLANQQLSILHSVCMCIYVNPIFSICPTLSCPNCIHKSIFYILSSSLPCI